MLKGIISGIALSLLVLVGVFSATQFVSGEGDGHGRGDSNDRVIWRDAGSADRPDTTSGTSGTFGDGNGADRTGTATTGGRGAEGPQASAPGGGTTGANMARTGYVALGDSVAAGLGLPTWDDATAQDRRCGRSPEAYAFETGRQLGLPHALFACSGASTGDLFTRQWVSNSNPNVQLDQAFANGVPRYMSITAGANDIAWRQIMQRCYTRTCGSVLQTSIVDAGLIVAQRNLVTAMNQIRERSGGNPPTVVLTGYYNPASGACTAFTGGRITATEITWLTQSVDALNQTIRDVANSYPFARYAEIDFNGHDVCSGDPWVQGLQDEAPIHPTAEGQSAISRAVVAAFDRPQP